jgi:hypothetical protein
VSIVVGTEKCCRQEVQYGQFGRPAPWKYETVFLGHQHSDNEDRGIPGPVVKRKVVG